MSAEAWEAVQALTAKAKEHSALKARLRVWIEVLESCLPTDEGYDDDTEAVLKNVIESMRRQLVPRVTA